MKQISKKLGSVLLALCMVLTLLPSVAFAADTSSLASTIESYTGGTGATGSLSASVSGSTVTVTGEVTGADANFNLNINAGVTVIWKATITTADDFTADLFVLSGNGTFEVAEGGKITSTKGVAILSNNTTDATDIIVNGTVSAAYDHAISISGKGATVDVSGGTVRGGEDNDGSLDYEAYSAIRIIGDNTTVNIGGGYVTATSGTAIYSEGDATTVNVSDGTISSDTCIAIHCIGDDAEVNISGGEVFNSESGGSTIDMTDASSTGSGKLVVSGTGLVQAKGEAPAGVVPVRAIYTNGSVTVDGGAIQADHGEAIVNISSSGKMTEINDGTVSATSDNAIRAPYVTVNGGAVSATSGNAIRVMSEAEINGGTVSAITGHAISTTSHSSVVSVKGGVVSTTTGCAINAETAGATLSISGGAVFAYASSISDVIDPVNFPDTVPTGTGVVIAWAQNAGITTYNQGDSGNLSVSPSDATTKWANSGDQCGISFSYTADSTTNSGFIAVDGVTVVKSSVTADKLVATNLDVNATYTGSPQALVSVTAASGVSLGEITVYYTGINGTDYTRSATAPTNAGTYQITADVAENDDYAATSNIDMGLSVGIAKANAPTLTWPTAASITYGQTLADSTLSGGTEGLGTFDWTDGTIAPNVITNGGYEVTFTPSEAALQNYNIAATTKIVPVTVAKATANSVSKTYQVKTGSEQTYRFDLTTLLPDGVDASAYTVSGHSTIGIVFSAAPTVSGTTLTLPITSVGAANQTASVLISFTSDNYDISDATVTVEAVDKTPVTITASITGGVYNSQPYAYSNAVVTANTDSSNVTDSVTLEASYEGIAGTTYDPSADAPKNAGSYQLTLSVPDTDATYTGSAVHTFTIAKRPVTVKADNKSVTVGSDPIFTYTVDGQLSGETALSGQPLLAYAAGNTYKAGSYTIGVYLTGVTYTANYMAADPAYVNGTLTVSAASSGNETPSGGGSSTPATPAPTVSGSTATTTVTAQTGTNGTASASVTQSQVTSAIEKAQAAAKSSGEAPGVEIHVSGGTNASAVQTTIPKVSVQAMASGGMDSMTLSSSVAAMTFDAQAIAAIAGAASGDVKFSASKVDSSTLPDTARQVVGDRPVYNFSVTSGSSAISQFGGAVTVSVPYTPAVGETVNAIVAYYINANGEPELMQNCHYDTQTGTLVFTTTHFSTYAVGYHKVAFSDVAEDAWCYDAVIFLAARGITGGTTETTFSPNATLTRGQFITLVLRAYGIEPDENPTDNFTDAGDTYYTGYLASAKRLGISSGIGNNKFAPDQAITRQEMFTLLYNALKAIDQLPEADSGKALSDFTDSQSISSYAQEAIAYLVKTGVVGGNNGQLSPMNTTTRAQMAQVLYNLLYK